MSEFTPEQERQARARGFPSARAAVDWQRQRENARGTNAPIRGSSAAEKKNPAKKKASGGMNGWIDTITKALGG